MEHLKPKQVFSKNNKKMLSILQEYFNSISFSKVFVLVDQNTKKYCFPLLKNSNDLQYELIEIKAGEEYKNIETTMFLWRKFTNLGADRNSILINLGGGVITDMGGFAAATFKRGMRFINIPTTLLSMVDAAIGGKTGIDFINLKNQIGLFANSEMTLINPSFLNTLSQRELRSGLAEVIKYGLIDKNKIWESIKETTPDSTKVDASIIETSARIKENVVIQDPKEKGIRKTLNFGHTLGHAIETHFMSKPKENQLLHGEAIAIGMILATHLSTQTQEFPTNKTQIIATVISKLYPKINFKESDYLAVLELLKHDKKNSGGKVNFILLKEFGEPVLDCQVTEKHIRNAFDFYAKL